MELVLQRMRDANDLVQRAGPYVLLELLIPGGTLFALLLFLYRRAQRRPAALDWAFARLEDALGVRMPAGTPQHEERDGLEPLGYDADR